MNEAEGDEVTVYRVGTTIRQHASCLPTEYSVNFRSWRPVSRMRI